MLNGTKGVLLDICSTDLELLFRKDIVRILPDYHIDEPKEVSDKSLLPFAMPSLLPSLMLATAGGVWTASLEFSIITNL